MKLVNLNEDEINLIQDLLTKEIRLLKEDYASDEMSSSEFKDKWREVNKLLIKLRDILFISIN